MTTLNHRLGNNEPWKPKTWCPASWNLYYITLTTLDFLVWGSLTWEPYTLGPWISTRVLGTCITYERLNEALNEAPLNPKTPERGTLYRYPWLGSRTWFGLTAIDMRTRDLK